MIKKRLVHFASLFIIIATSLALPAQGQDQPAQSRPEGTQAGSAHGFNLLNLLAQTRPARRGGFALMPLSVTPLAAPAPNLPVQGNGTVGRLTKWTGVTSSNSVIGDTTIFEDKFGKVGVGTDAPTSKLTVAGQIEITLGGLKFPDGTLQTTAFSPNGVVRSLNGLTGNITLASGANITITPSGNTLTIAAAGALTNVAHNTTLVGNGTVSSPLGVAVPLMLTGPINNSAAVLDVSAGFSASGTGGFAVSAAGGFGVTGGEGLRAFGAAGSTMGGNGVRALGGDSNSPGTAGASGIAATGGNNSSGFGGAGVTATGGDSNTDFGGIGVFVDGGRGLAESGGDGVNSIGGTGSGAGHTGGVGIFGISGPGINGATNGLAGFFSGDVEITGKLKVDSGIKMFHIDHPLDPENKYLNHAAIESSEVLNVYSGNITTDQTGDAIVGLPDWFEALNKDFRYQLTVIGAFAQAIVADEIKGNRFAIKTSAPNVKVSWQVTGVRNDRGMRKQQFKVEEEKTGRERGHYLQPEAFDQPEEKSIRWAQHPERMQQLKQRQKSNQR